MAFHIDCLRSNVLRDHRYLNVLHILNKHHGLFPKKKKRVNRRVNFQCDFFQNKNICWASTKDIASIVGIHFFRGLGWIYSLDSTVVVNFWAFSKIYFWLRLLMTSFGPTKFPMFVFFRHLINLLIWLHLR